MKHRQNAGDICSRDVKVVSPGDGVSDAAAVMREQHVGALIVVEERTGGPFVAGMLTDRDIVTAIVAKGVDPQRLRVGDVMRTEVVTAGEDDSLMDVLGAMRRAGVRRVPVVGAKGRLIGIVALDDVLGVVATELRWLFDVVQGGQRRELAKRPGAQR